MADNKEMDDALSSVLKKYPKLQGYDWAIVDSRGKDSKHGGSIEFYSPDESESPVPGKPTIEVFDKNLKGDKLERALFGDMLHHLPSVDPQFEEMRQKLQASLTDEQKAVDQKSYEKAKSDYGEDRPIDQWMNQSRLDAYVRGRLAPDDNNDWKDVYTEDQHKLLNDLEDYLKKPKNSDFDARSMFPNSDMEP